jgi:hypothetical protein
MMTDARFFALGEKEHKARESDQEQGAHDGVGGVSNARTNLGLT